MKKTGLILAMMFVAAMFYTSCKGDYTCTCKGTIMGHAFSADTTFTDVKESDAEDSCDKLESEVKDAGSSDASCEVSEK